MPHDPMVWIDTVLARAAELRAAGVLSIEYDDVGGAATFAELPPAPVATGNIDPPDAQEHIGDPLHDPASYPGGVVPGFVIERLEIED